MQELGLRPVRMVPTATTLQPESASTGDISLRQNGDVWTIEYGNQVATVRDAKGLHMLAKLVARPNTDIHVLDLSGVADTVREGDAGPMLDEQARQDYRHRISDLQEELEEAESLADLGRADSLRADLDSWLSGQPV